MSRNQLLHALEQAAVTTLAVCLGAIIANATTISPTYGGILGALASSALSALNSKAEKPVLKILSAMASPSKSKPEGEE